MPSANAAAPRTDARRATAQLRVHQDENSTRLRNGKAGATTQRSALSNITNKNAYPGANAGGKKAAASTGESASAFFGTGASNWVAPQQASNQGSLFRTSGSGSANNMFGDDVRDIDFGDDQDTQACAEYVQEIYEYHMQVQTKNAANPQYMASQTDITEKMRAILIDWLVDVHLRFKLVSETLYLTVNIIDRFLEKKTVARQRLQLVGVSAMLIASKYEEVFAPEVRDFVYICDKAYRREEILRMERVILNTLGFQLTYSSPGIFLKRFSKAAGSDNKARILQLYLVDLTLPEYNMLKYKPSELAAAAVYLSNRMENKPGWSATLTYYAAMSETAVLPIVIDLNNVLRKVTLSTSSNLQAVRKKYSSRKYYEVAKIPLIDI